MKATAASRQGPDGSSGSEAASEVHLEFDYSVVKPDDFSQRWLVRFELIPVPPL